MLSLEKESLPSELIKASQITTGMKTLTQICFDSSHGIQNKSLPSTGSKKGVTSRNTLHKEHKKGGQKKRGR